jgi:hypothetical protein
MKTFFEKYQLALFWHQSSANKLADEYFKRPAIVPCHRNQVSLTIFCGFLCQKPFANPEIPQY